jgi:hypothetical protein
MIDKLSKVNAVLFPQKFVERLRVKLMLNYKEVTEYILEYRKFLYLIALSS